MFDQGDTDFQPPLKEANVAGQCRFRNPAVSTSTHSGQPPEGLVPEAPLLAGPGVGSGSVVNYPRAAPGCGPAGADDGARVLIPFRPPADIRRRCVKPEHRGCRAARGTPIAIGCPPSYEESDARHPPPHRPHAGHATVDRMSGDTPRSEAGVPLLPQGLPRRPRSTPAAPLPPEGTAEASGTDDDADDTLRPDALARAIVAIQRGSTRARLGGPDDTDSTDGRPAPRPGPDAA